MKTNILFLSSALLALLSTFVRKFDSWAFYGPGKTLIYTIGWLLLAITVWFVYIGLEAGVLVVLAAYFLTIHLLLDLVLRKRKSRSTNRPVW